MPSPSQHLCEFTRYRTSDGLHLHALLWAAPAGGDSLVMLVPGYYGAFTGTHDYRPLADALNADGHAFMAINMRTANDFTDPRLQDAVIDIAAAVSAAKERGYRRFVLMGTSLGGPRSALYLTHTDEPAIKAYGLIAAIKSPYEAAVHYMDEERLSRLDRTIQQACAMVADGRGAEVVVYDNIFNHRVVRMTARGFVNVFGSPDVTDISLLKQAPRVRLPTAIFHGLADQVSLPPNAQDIHDALTAAPSRELVWMDGATHYLEPGWIAEAYAQRIAPWANAALSSDRR
jgi:alpha-beta hydrolase superfamily lysophospholipase